MKPHAFRLTKGMDLFGEIKSFCERNNILAGTVLSSVGCVDQARIRCADGKTVIELSEPLEIISLNGTVSKNRCHLHASFSKVDLSVIGGHLIAPPLTVHTTARFLQPAKSCYWNSMNLFLKKNSTRAQVTTNS